jgi:CRP/FNR family transcriptional regulator, cyclic AMP receptor protein
LIISESEHAPLSKPSKPSSADQPDGGIPLGLNQIPLLKILSAQDRQQVLGEMTETRYEKGQYIFREGDPTEYFHIVKEGSVKCVKSSLDGKECTLKVLMPGDLFCCDASAFDGASHPGTAQPMGDVSVLRMKKEAYFKMLRANPDAAMEVIRYLGNRLNEAQEKAKVLALDSADQRLASLLVGLAERSGVQDSNGIRLSVRLTRQDMANMVGVTTETAIRIMARFKKDGLVSGTAARLVVRDLPRLKHLAST